MIVKTSQRGDGEALADHLLDVEDGNEEVFVRPSPFAPRGATLHQAIALLEAKAVGTRATQPLVHASISPRDTDPPMTDDEWRLAWEIYEKENNLAGHDYVEVWHTKTRQGSSEPSQHRHRVYTRVIPENDPLVKPKCVTLRFPKITNELIQARICMETGRQMQPGPNIKTTEKWARERGDHVLAEYIKTYIDRGPTPARGAPTLPELQSAKRAGRSAAADHATIYTAWEGSKGDRKAFERALSQAGLVVERGDKTLIVRQRGTALQYSLPRAIAAGAKQAGVDLKSKAAGAEIAGVYGDAADVQKFVPGDRWRMATEAPERLIVRPLLSNESSFDDDQLDARIALMEPPSEAEALDFRARILADAGVVKLADGRYSSTEMMELERGMVARAAAMAQERVPFLAPPAIAAAIARQDEMLAQAGFRIGADQARAVEQVLDGRLLTLLEGYAGAGKSTTMSAVADAWRSGGGTILGVAPSGKAAAELAGAVGETRTIASLLIKLDKGELKLDDKTLLLVDEAGMVGSRDMAALLEAAQAAKARVVLLGDTKQLQAVAAGGAMLAIKERVPASHAETLTTVVRQKHQWMRDASIALNSGRTADGLRAYSERGMIHFVGDAVAKDATDSERVAAMRGAKDATRARLIADWQAHLDAKGSTIILAHTRADVAALNIAARDVWRQRNGQAGAEIEHEIEVRAKDEIGENQEGVRAKRTFANGDRIIFTKNDATVGVKNGNLGTLTMLADGRFSVLLDGKKQPVEFDPKEFRHFDYGWASTVHASQGVTVDRAYALASRSMNESLALVAATRHKSSFGLYASFAEFAGLDELAERLGRSERKRTTLDSEVVSIDSAPAPIDDMRPAFPPPEIDREAIRARLAARMAADSPIKQEIARRDAEAARVKETPAPQKYIAQQESAMRHKNSDDELAHFRRQDLNQYLARQGYAPTRDGKMQRGDAQYYVKRRLDGEWQAWDNRATGSKPYSIIDVHIRDNGGNLGQARAALRAQYPGGQEIEQRRSKDAQQSAERASKDAQKAADKVRADSQKSNEDLAKRAAEQRQQRMRDMEAKRQAAKQLYKQRMGSKPVPANGGHLQQRRGIPAHVQTWAGVRYDERQAAYLASMTRGEASPELTPTSYEKVWGQPDGSTARAQMKDGVKGNAQFGAQQSPSRIVIAESGIDAMSYATDDPQRDSTMYISTGGTPSEYARQHIADLSREHPNAAFVMAHDRDEAGHKQAQELSEIVRAEREQIGVEANVERHTPPERHMVGPDGRSREATDWNDNRRLNAGLAQEAEPPREEGPAKPEAHHVEQEAAAQPEAGGDAYNGGGAQDYQQEQEHDTPGIDL